jgi:HAD superfamily hydrolase (TIGR01549 family)
MLNKMASVKGMLAGFFSDLDGTLIRAPEEDFYETLLELGMEFPLEEVYSAYMAARVWYRSSSNPYNTGEELWKGFADQVLLRLGIKDYPEDLLEKIKKGMDKREEERLYPETIPFLQHLKDKGLYLAIISSRPLEGVEQKLVKFGLSRYFSLVLGRESVREIKPSPLPFLVALKQSGLKTEEVAYAGDSLEEDLKGAQAAGIRAYLVDRRGRFPREPYIVRNLLEILERENLK